MNYLITIYLVIIFFVSLLILLLTLKLNKIRPINLWKFLLLFVSLVIFPFLLFYFVLNKYYQVNWKKALLMWLTTLVFNFVAILFIAFIIRNFIFQPFLVDGNAMSPTLNDKEYTIIKKFDKKYTRGDVIIFHPPNNPNNFYIKRIIAIPGDEIQISNGQVLLNRELLKEQYVTGKTEGNINKKLSDNEYFVLGDNRENSSDSREFGTISKDSIAGKSFVK